MNNPWVDLPRTQPFVLPYERSAIREFNASAKPTHQIRTELMPEPYLGDPNAPVVLLNLNPGFMEEEIYFHTEDEDFIRECRANLLHEPSEYPFYLINPKLSASEGHKWWKKKLRQPIEISSAMKVAKSFLCIEYFPYHSQRFKCVFR